MLTVLHCDPHLIAIDKPPGLLVHRTGLEEILEVMALKQLGYHRKPIAVLDLDGFYQPRWGQIQRGIDTGFIKPEYLDLWYPAPDVDALLRYLEGYVPHGYGAKWP